MCCVYYANTCGVLICESIKFGANIGILIVIHKFLNKIQLIFFKYLPDEINSIKKLVCFDVKYTYF